MERTSVEALRRGTLCPIPSTPETVEQDGIRFLVRVVSSEAFEELKREYAKQRGKAGGTPRNPFLPPDESLLVGDVSTTHYCVLNKFNVVEHHLLIVTREFEEQEGLLTLHDFEALWTCMAEYEALGFYNSGQAAGASQPHKHLQMVPLPLDQNGQATPIETLIVAADLGPEPRRASGLPYPHLVAACNRGWTSEPARAATESLVLYRAMLRRLGLLPGDAAVGVRPAPYNLLATRRWMLMVPRSREFVESISINALGFAGALLARNAHQLERIRRRGPMNLLCEASAS
jgi:ATP adenylyltransferase